MTDRIEKAGVRPCGTDGSRFELYGTLEGGEEIILFTFTPPKVPDYAKMVLGLRKEEVHRLIFDPLVCGNGIIGVETNHGFLYENNADGSPFGFHTLRFDKDVQALIINSKGKQLLRLVVQDARTIQPEEYGEDPIESDCCMCLTEHAVTHVEFIARPQMKLDPNNCTDGGLRTFNEIY